MTDNKSFRIFATSRIGDPAENRLRKRGLSKTGSCQNAACEAGIAIYNYF